MFKSFWFCFNGELKMTISYPLFDRFDETKSPKYLQACLNSDGTILVQSCEVKVDAWDIENGKCDPHSKIIFERTYKSIRISFE